MPFTRYAALIKETSTDTGTGSLALDGAVAGFRAFSDAFAFNDFVGYTIIAEDGNFEIGIGSYGTNSILRIDARVISSSNNNNVVDFAAGNKTVLCTPMPHHASLNAYRVLPDGQSYNDNEDINFSVIEHDPHGFVSVPTTKLLVPNWAHFMRVTGYVYFSFGQAGDRAGIWLKKLTGSTYTLTLEKWRINWDTDTPYLPICSGWLEPSEFNNEKGILMETDISRAMSIGGVITVEWAD